MYGGYYDDYCYFCYICVFDCFLRGVCVGVGFIEGNSYVVKVVYV